MANRVPTARMHFLIISGDGHKRSGVETSSDDVQPSPPSKNVRPEAGTRSTGWHRKALVRRETRQAPEAEGSNESRPVQARPQSRLSYRVREVRTATLYVPHNFNRHYSYPRLRLSSITLAEPSQAKPEIPSFFGVRCVEDATAGCTHFKIESEPTFSVGTSGG